MGQENERNAPKTRASKVRLRSFDTLDCRTSAAKHARDLVSGLEADLGGTDALSVGQREIIKRAAVSSALCEDLEVRWLEGETIEVADYVQLSNLQRRLLATIGFSRVPRDVSLRDDELSRKFYEHFAEASP